MCNLFFPEVLEPFGALRWLTPPPFPLPAAAARRGEGGIEKGLRRAAKPPAANPFSPSSPRFGEEKGAGG